MQFIMSAQNSNNQEGTRQEIESLPPGLNYLKGLEELMKCPICFDYLQAPMLLPNCDHNYCSLCIRKYLTLKEQCPACGCKASSNLLRSNQILAKVIKQFKTIVTPLAKLNQQGRQHEKAALLEDGDEKGRNSKLRGALVRRRSLAVKENESAIDNPKCKEKSGTVASGEQTENTAANDVDQTTRQEPQPQSDSGDSDVEILSEDSSSSAQSSRPSGLTKTRHSLSFLSPPKETDGPKSKTVQSKLFRPTSPSSGGKDGVKENSTFKQVQSSKSSLVLNSSPKGISALVSSQMRNSRSSGVMEKVLSLVPESEEQKSSVSNSLSVRASQFFSSPGGSQQNAPGISSPSGSPLVEKVPCPVCGIPVVSHAVNRHLDMCLASQGKRVSRRSLDKRKSLPKLVYNLLSEKDLRKRLKQLALNSQGDRQTMIKRHHEFTLYFNADCDSLAPKDMSELVKEFEETQKLQKKLSSKSSTSGQSILRFTKDSKKEDVEKANKEYASKNKNQFQSLIQQARSGMRSARQRQATASMSTSTAADPDQAPTQTVASHSETKQTGVSSAADVHLDREEDNDDDGVHSLDKHHSVPSHQADSSTIPHVFTLDTDKDERMSQDAEEDSGEETGSDVFEYNPDSKSVEKVVPTEVKAKSKRALRPSKPTWKDADDFEILSEDFSSSDRSQLDSSLEGSRGASSLNCEVAAVAEVCVTVSAMLSGKSNPGISQKVPSPEVSQEKSHRDTEVSQPKEKSSLADEPSSKVSHNASLGDRDVTQLIKQSHANGCSSDASLGDFCNTLPVDPMPKTESAPRERKRKRACKVPAQKEEQPKKPKRQKSQSTSSEGVDISHADCQNQSQSVSDAEDTSPQKNQEVATETSKKYKVSAKKKTTKSNRSEIVNEAGCLLGTSQKDLKGSQLHAVQVSTKLATVTEESQEMMEGMSEEEDAGELVSATEEREVGGPATTTGSFEERETAPEDQQRLEGDQQEGGESTEAPLPVPKLKSLLKQKSASHHMKSVRFAGLRARVSDIPYLSQQSFSESVEDDTKDDADKECSNADNESVGDMENRVELEESVDNEKEISAEDELHRGDGGEKGMEVGVEIKVHGNADGVHSSCEGRSGGTEEAHTEACVENKGEDDLTKSTQSNMTNMEDKVIMKEQSVEEVCKENMKKKKPAQKKHRRRIKVLLRPCMKDEENEFTSMKLSPKSLNHLSSKSKKTATSSVKPAPKSCDHVSSKSKKAATLSPKSLDHVSSKLKESATSSDHKIEDTETVAALEVEDEPVRTHQRKKPVEAEPVRTHQQKKPVEAELVQTHQRKKSVEDEPVQTHQLKKSVEAEPVQTHQRKKSVEDEPVQTHQRKKPVEDEPVQTHQRKKSVEDEPVQTHQRKKSVEDEPVPTHRRKKSVEDEPVQTHRRKKSVEDEPVPTHQRKKPVEAEPVPTHQRKKPVEDEPVPTHQRKKPVEAEPVPTHQRKKPVEDEPVQTHQRKKSVEDEPVPTHRRKKSVEDEPVQTHQGKKPRSRAHKNENGRASSSTVTEQTDTVMGKKHSHSKATSKKLTESIPDSSESKGSKTNDSKVTENIPNAEIIPNASQSKGSESANNEVTENIPDSSQRHSPKTKQKKHRRNTVADITGTENIPKVSALVALSIVREKETSSIKGKANSKKRRYTEVEELRYNEERSDDFVEEIILSPADAVKTKQRKARRK